MTKSASIQVGVHAAKTRLSELLRLVDAGTEVEIVRNGEPVARLVRTARREPRVFGQDRGRFDVPDDFNEPLPDAILDEFSS